MTAQDSDVASPVSVQSASAESARAESASPEPAGGEPVRAAGGVQSIERAFELLEMMADSGGVLGLSQLATRSGLPLPTIHRLMRTLVNLGYVRQEPSREYALGPRLVRLGDSSSALLGRWAVPHLQHLVEQLGESANLTMLEGIEVVYVAQSQGRHSMRMFTEVGRRARAHSTAAGKVMLAQLPPDGVGEILRRTTLVPQTSHTITDHAALFEELDRIRERGYAIDDQEQELGVRCVAVALPGSPTRAAVSVSGPVTRMIDELIQRCVPQLHEAAQRLAADLALAGRGHGVQIRSL